MNPDELPAYFWVPAAIALWGWLAVDTIRRRCKR